MSGKPTVISIFAGTGGSSLGYKWAGFHELLAIDWEAHAVECFRLNFPEVPIWHRDITKVSGQEILDFCKIGKGQLDVFDGSPPCQGFSTAGRRDVNDPRNDLFKHYCRLIKELSPKVFVMENVSGMAKGKMKGRFLEILKELKSLGYNVKCKQMNAMYYGVPQSRLRLIFIGVREDIKKEPQFPIPSTKIISVREALKCNGYQEYRPNYSEGSVSFKGTGFNKPALTVTKTIPAKFHRGQFDKKHMNTMNTMNTITKVASARFVFDGYERLPTIEELLILCSFPTDWKMNGSFVQQWARLGNAVMPKFMQAIAEHIKTNILI